MIRTFLDAGVLIACARGCAPVAERVLGILDDPEREFVSTSLLELEVLPKAVHNKKSEETAFYRGYLGGAAHQVVDESLIGRACKRAQKLGLSALDALHLEAAISAGATEFITTEKPTKPFFAETEITVTSISGNKDKPA